jgi:hypothetical protein
MPLAHSSIANRRLVPHQCYGCATVVGLVRPPTRDIVRRVQLIQIRQPATATVQQLIQQMAEQQFAEIEQLRHDALVRQSVRKVRKVTTSSAND